MPKPTFTSNPLYRPLADLDLEEKPRKVLSLDTMRKDIFCLSVKSANQDDGFHALKYAQAATHLAAAWQTLKETEIHEKFHTDQEEPAEYSIS